MMENRNWFAWRAVAGIVLVGLLVAGGFAIYRLGWSQGFAAAEIVAQGEEIPTPPLLPQGWRPTGSMPGGLLIALVLGLIFFALVGKLIRFIIWGVMVGPAMRYHAAVACGRHPCHWMHGSVPSRYNHSCAQPSDRPQRPEDSAGAEA